MATREIRIPIVGDSSQLKKELDKSEDHLAGFGANAAKLATKFKREFLALGAGITFGLGYAVKTAMDFEQQMSEVGATSGAVGNELDNLREAAIKAGAATVFNAKEAATAESELAKAGVSVADVLGGGLTGALNLAAAGSLGVADAATYAAQAMAQFKLKGSDVPRIADALAAGANKALGGVEDLGQGLGEAGGVANTFGLSLEETTGVLALFAQNGQLGAEGGTALKTTLLRLGAPAGDAAQAMERLGLTFYDSAGQFVGISAAAEQLKTKLSGLTEEQRNQALQTIFGNRAIKGATILMQAGAAGVGEWTAAVSDSGYAAKLAGQKTDNLAGDLEQLRGSLETALIQGGSQATDALRGLARGATDAVNSFAAMPEPVQKTILGLTGLVGVGSTAIGVWGTLGPKVEAFRNSLSNLGGIAPTVAANMGLIGASAAGVGVPLAVLGLAWSKHAADLRENIDLERSLAQALANTTDSLNEGTDAWLKNQLVTSDRGKEMSDILAKGTVNIGDLTRGIRENGTELDKWRDAIANYGRSWADLEPEIRSAAGSGNVAAQVLVDLADNSDVSDKQLAQLIRDMDYWNDRVDGAIPRTEFYKNLLGDTADNTSALGTATSGTAGAFDDAQQTIDDAVKALKEWYDQTTSQLSAQIKYEASIDAVTEAVKKNGTTLDLNTEKGRDNVQSFIAAKDAIVDYGVEIYNTTGDTDQASYATQLMVEKLKDTMRQAGLSGQAVADYITQLGLTPQDISTNFHLGGLFEAQVAINTFIWTNSNRTIPITVKARVDAAQLAAIQQYGGIDGDPRTPRAMGGRVDPNHPYLTGEWGRETFWPDAYGSIITASQTGALFGGGGGGGGTSITIQNLTLPNVTNPDDFVEGLQKWVKVNGPLPVPVAA